MKHFICSIIFYSILLVLFYSQAFIFWVRGGGFVFGYKMLWTWAVIEEGYNCKFSDVVCVVSMRDVHVHVHVREYNRCSL